MGYGFRGEKLSANINVYHTTWNDRTEIASFQRQDGTLAFANILGVNALHKGVELDFVYRATDNLKLTGMASIGDWRWKKAMMIIYDWQHSNKIDWRWKI